MQTRFKEQAADSLLPLILKMLDGLDFKTFALGVHCKPEEKEELKKELQQPLLRALEKQTGKPASFNAPELFILINCLKNKIKVELKPLCIQGRYNKFDRTVAQTFHYCFKCKGKGCAHCKSTGKLSESSVQELVAAPAQELFQADDNRFHGQGREDVDVLMLGKGRKFILELLEPKKRSADLKTLEEKINADKRLKISNLKFCSRAEIAELKLADPEKIYEAVVQCKEEEISEADLKKLEGQELKIEQKTPLRVIKRRKDMTRHKQAKIIKVKFIDSTHFSVQVQASAGLYIKEFVSGDKKRTLPSIAGLLGKDCFCAQLDVLEIIEK